VDKIARIIVSNIYPFHGCNIIISILWLYIYTAFKNRIISEIQIGCDPISIQKCNHYRKYYIYMSLDGLRLIWIILINDWKPSVRSLVLKYNTIFAKYDWFFTKIAIDPIALTFDGISLQSSQIYAFHNILSLALPLGVTQTLALIRLWSA